MVWFISLFLTGLATLLGTGLYWLKEHNLPGLDSILNALLPTFPSQHVLSASLVIVLQLACFTFFRFLFRQTATYLEDTEAAPRRFPRLMIRTPAQQTTLSRAGAFSALIGQGLRSSQNDWTVAFVPLLVVVLAISLPLVLFGKASAAAWGMSALFVVTLIGIRREPDQLFEEMEEM